MSKIYVPLEEPQPDGGDYDGYNIAESRYHSFTPLNLISQVIPEEAFTGSELESESE